MIEETEGASSPAEEAVREDPAPAVEEAAAPTELERAIAERDAAIEEKNQCFERLQRAQAEFENIRKRLEREQKELREYAAMSTIESLLPILDDFERAIAADGAVLIAEERGRIRRVSPEGIITTIVGATDTGDIGGPARSLAPSSCRRIPPLARQ